MNFDNRMIDGEIAVISHQFANEENYWLNKLSGKLVKSIFPYDYPGAIENKSIKEHIKFQLTADQFSLLMKLSKNSDPKLHMILLSALTIFLNKYTGNNDIILGTPIYKQDIEDKFINTVLTVRNAVTEDMPFKELLQQVRETCVEADAHQNYPIEVLLQKLQIINSNHSFPLFDAALLIENIQKIKYLDHIPLQMVFSFLRTGESVEGILTYNAALYKETTAQQIVGHFIRVLELVLNRVDIKICDIDILSDKEKHQLLIEFNDTDASYPGNKLIHQWFEEQVERTPDNIAVIDPSGDRITYRELNERANSLAHFLLKSGIHLESVIGIKVDRSIDNVVGLIAILKAGGAYLPIDPGLPAQRVAFMLENSTAHSLLTESHAISNIPFTQLQGFEEKKEARIHITAPRPPITGFDALPIPDRSHINLLNYKNKIGMASVTNCISIQTTRGCPYECLYCHKIWSKKHVHRSAENIYSEIEYFYKNGVTNFAIIDDCFNLNIRESSKVFELIIKNKLKIQIFFPNGLRGDIMTPEYIDLMVEAGTRGINLSLETASPRLQKLLMKNLHLDKFKEVVNYIATAHSEIILEMATMHGFPSETEEEAMMTLNFIKDIKWLHFPYIHILKIFPNTEMEAFALEQGISKKDIMISKDRAFHELPETLPFPKSFTRQYQAGFLNEYFLAKERLTKVLPVQMNILSETALVQKYNAYLPVEIKTIKDVIEFARLEDVQIPENYGHEIVTASIFDRAPAPRTVISGAHRILLLDLSQHFRSHRMLYRVVEQPLGEIYLLSYLKQKFGNLIDGRIYKSGNDFDSFNELKKIILDFEPELIGIRTLTFFKEFFHETAACIRDWGVQCPIITGGPYASSDYDTILKDKNIDLVVLGEGEYTLGELIEEMLKIDFSLPAPDVLNNIKGIVYAENYTGTKIQRQVILMDKLAEVLPVSFTSNPGLTLSPNNLAYVMYTSGSTGEPKGVMVEHRQVYNCISWMQEKFYLTAKDVIIQRTNLSFDPSVWEIFWPLMVGGSVKVLTQQQSRNAEYLLQLMAHDEDASMMYCPSPLVKAMTHLLNQMNEKPRLKLPWLIIGAESISPNLVKNFYSYYEGKIVNTYGPTECTINNTFYDIDRLDQCPIVPIGKPVANNKIYILSPEGKLQPVKVAGEIHIAGESVARGYINNREKTNAYFIENPFGSGKLYKTGDVGRWLEDGNIEIMGRTDEQIKIRGYRIEPGEIRSVLLNHEAIEDCLITVMDKRDTGIADDKIQTCKICGITSRYPGVKINDDGICDICKMISKYQPTLQNYFKPLEDLAQHIRDANKAKTSPYDCLLLYSGGRGAANALYRLHDMGFNILAATYDNGYMGKANLDNIKKITSQLHIDHVMLTHKNTAAILRESMKTAHTVCRGCFLTSSSLAAEYAYKNNIKVVIGATLSRGQIIDNKLFMFLQQGISDIKELEGQVFKFQKNIPQIEKSFFDLIDIDAVKDGDVYEKVTFLDFYRYCDMTNDEMIAYLNERDSYWKTRKNHAIYSTNCPIKQIGDYAHLNDRGYHFYGTPTSWEKRLGHLTFKNIKEDLECHITAKGFANFLKHIQYDDGKKDEKQDKYLCAYFIPNKSNSENDYSSTELRKYLLQKLPEYMVPNYFVQLDQIPLTSNGKVDKKALPLPKMNVTKVETNYVAPTTEEEKTITNIWEEVLEIDKIGIHDNFFELGGHSLTAITLVSRMHKDLNVQLPLSELFKTPTIRELSNYIKTLVKENCVSITPIEKKKYYSLSSTQARLYILNQMDLQGTGYNIPFFSILEGEIDKDRFEHTLRNLVHRHESLRTSFHMINGLLVQIIHPKVEFEIECFATGVTNEHGLTQTPSEILLKFIQPFDLSKAPLLRIGLVKEEGDRHILMVDMHHIISDGTSMNILVKDFMALYQGKYLSELHLQYKDFSNWQKDEKQAESLKQQEEYWLNEFAGEIPVLELPADYPRLAVQSFEGNRIPFEIDKESTAVLKTLTLKAGITLYMLLLAIYTLFLSKITGQEEIVIGSPIAGRRHMDLAEIIGMFVNTLVMRNYPSGEKPFSLFLQEVKEKTLKAFENQDYQYEELVEKVAVTRDTSRNPLFDTMFVLQNIEIAEINIPGLKLSPYPYENKTAKFDLSLTAVEAEKKLLFNLEYCTKLFEEKTANRFITYFKNVVNGVIENKNGRISDFGIITEEEKKRILVDFNNTEAEYPKDKTIHQLFEEQATQTPDYIALHGCMIAWMDGEVARNVSITYRQLNEQSDRLAVLLIDKGVQPDTIVGIMIERSIEMIIGIMGVLKAGGAYLPIDPEYPRERIDYILKDSGAAILLTDEKKTNCQLSIVNTQLLTSEHRVYLQYSSFILNGRPSRGLHHSNLAYVIYTSGSTGKPKGVMIEHQAVHNFIEGITRIIEFKPGKTILALTTITFDIFGLETLLPMCRGLKVVMATENHQREIPLLEQLIIKNCIDMLQATPSRMQMFTMDGIVSTCLRGLKEIMVGGEGFPAKLLQELKRSSSAKIYNMYGPTETTIWSSVSELTKTDAIKVGLPINNTQIYILNKYSKIQPIGIAGELHIGGDGLARGYINRPELTAEKFIPLIPLMAQMTQMKNKNSALRVNFHQSPLTTHLSPLYKTGDLCKWLPNANIEFLGRIDYQVKIRGYRIELGEIENRLLKHEEIKDVVAISKEKIAGDKYIAAYFVSNIELLVAELREFLLKTLPDYMIPSHFVQLEKIPLTSNGKVDRKILDTYEVRIEDRIEYVAPRNSFEKEIAAIWKEELNVEVIGIYDNFFELGGNSLNIIRINNKLKDIYGKAISVLTIFRYPTIHSLSQYMDQENTETRFSDESIKESVQMMVDTALLLMEEDDE